MEIIKGDPKQEPNEEDVRLTIKIFESGDDIGFYMQGADSCEDPELLSLFSTLNQVIAQTISGLERKILTTVLNESREERRKEREVNRLMEQEVEGDPN
jgi:hypothetical protein